MLNTKKRVYNIFWNKIKLSKNIALVSHKNPDLDTLGSSLVFYEILTNMFLNKKVDLICIDDIPEKFNVFKNIDNFNKDFNPTNYDLIIFFDCSNKYQTGFFQKDKDISDFYSYNTVCIDHHSTNDFYAKQNILNTTYSSTTMIVFEILLLLNINISKNISTILLAGLFSDTGGFKNPNTNKITYFIASKLLELGADYDLIVNRFFKNNKLKTIKLWGKILSDSILDYNGILFSYVNKSLLESYDCDYENISGVIDYLNTTQNIKYTSLLTQKGEFIKASLRTLRDDIDLTIIAKKFNGGGHKKACGFTVNNSLLKN